MIGRMQDHLQAIYGFTCEARAESFVVDTEAWADPAAVPDGPPSSLNERLRQLRDAGWTAVAVPPGTAFADLWRQAGTGHGQGHDVHTSGGRT